MAFAIVFIAYKFRFELRDEIVNLIVEQLKAHVNNRIPSFNTGFFRLTWFSFKNHNFDTSYH